MEVIVSVKPLLNSEEASRLQRILEAVYPGARVTIVSGNRLGPSEHKVTTTTPSALYAEWTGA